MKGVDWMLLRELLTAHCCIYNLLAADIRMNDLYISSYLSKSQFAGWHLPFLLHFIQPQPSGLLPTVCRFHSSLTIDSHYRCTKLFQLLI